MQLRLMTYLLLFDVFFTQAEPLITLTRIAFSDFDSLYSITPPSGGLASLSYLAKVILRPLEYLSSTPFSPAAIVILRLAQHIMVDSAGCRYVKIQSFFLLSLLFRSKSAVISHFQPRFTFFVFLSSSHFSRTEETTQTYCSFLFNQVYKMEGFCQEYQPPTIETSCSSPSIVHFEACREVAHLVLELIYLTHIPYWSAEYNHTSYTDLVLNLPTGYHCSSATSPIEGDVDGSARALRDGTTDAKRTSSTPIGSRHVNHVTSLRLLTK